MWLDVVQLSRTTAEQLLLVVVFPMGAHLCQPSIICLVTEQFLDRCVWCLFPTGAHLIFSLNNLFGYGTTSDVVRGYPVMR